MNSETRTASARVGLGIGAVMVGLGVNIAIRALATDASPLTGKLWLDLGFAFFFVVRGVLQYGRWKRASEARPG